MKNRIKQLIATGKTVHIPYASDHSYAIAASFEHIGIRANVLDEPNPSSFSLGLQYSSGRECLPFIIMAGDLVKLIDGTNFDPKRDLFFCPMRSDSCKHSLWGMGFERIIKNKSVPMESLLPATSIVKDEISDSLGVQFAMDVFWGIRAFDYISLKRCEVRPREKNPGETDDIYIRSRHMLYEGIKTGQTKKVLRNIVKIFDNIPVHKKRLPLVVILGDDYTKVNRFANHDIVNTIEEFGGQAYLQNFCMDSSRIQIEQRPWIYWNKKRYFDFITSVSEAWITRWIDRNVVNTYKKSLENLFIFDYQHIVKEVRGYLNPDLESDLISTLSHAIEAIQNGADGIINLVTFNCMIGKMASIFLERISERLDGPPLLNISLEGHYSTDILNRIEAFMHQVIQHYKRKKRHCIYNQSYLY